MLKNFFLARYQKKIDCLSPAVTIRLHKEIPLPSCKEIRSFSQIVSRVNSLEKEIQDKPAQFFKDKMQEFKQLIRERTQNIETEEFSPVVSEILDEILPYCFALVREAAKRTVRMRHFDVQILGGIVLHANRIAEMATGEGKTLVATLAASLNALVGRGVHIVTVNDYLARRDAEWMGPIYAYLGLSCGILQHDMDRNQRQSAYDCDITYGTNNEFGFDYLRDNMAPHAEEMVQREHFYAVVDEVDSILIDEARTPLIISGPAEVSVEKYYHADQVVRQLSVKRAISIHDTKDGTVVIKNTDSSESRMNRDEFDQKWDMIVEEKAGNAFLTRRGEERCEKLLGISSISEDTPDKFSNYWIHYVTNAGRAHYNFSRDKDYIVKDGKVIIVDEFTGRLMPGRRWSEGLHQAVEAKERLQIQQESQTLATITLQNYFRMYDKLAGMTGTAYTEANEFKHIYKLEVTSIPTNRPLERLNFADRIYKTKRAKFKAIVAEISESYTRKRPVLVGTASIEDSEELAFMLEKKGIPHNVLNAKYHEREAHIVAQAGRLGQVTIATNMAGRGTDIVLGGNLDFFIKEMLARDNVCYGDDSYTQTYEEMYSKHRGMFEEEHNKVVSLGGLHVIGAQRHEARRIDNQLKGRSGRQGDPGSSRFYISLEDDLMRLFGSERIYLLMDRFGLPEDDPIEHALVTHSIEVAQRRVEAHNFEIRKNLLKFDDVMNRQRETIYSQRREVLESSDIKDEILGMIDDVIDKNVEFYVQENNIEALDHWLRLQFGLQATLSDDSFDALKIKDAVKKELNALYAQRESDSGPEQMRQIEKMIALSIIDSRWKEHLLIMDSLKEGISLRGYAQVDPLVEYQKESYAAFAQMIDSIKESIASFVFKAKITSQRKIDSVFSQTPKSFVHSDFSSLRQSAPQTKSPPAARQQRAQEKKVGRNDPCPCGSGKKYKKCCGR